jgi:hypothetical protein
VFISQSVRETRFSMANWCIPDLVRNRTTVQSYKAARAQNW